MLTTNLTAALKTRLATAAAALLLCAPTLASAALESAEAAAEPRYLAQAVQQTLAATPPVWPAVADETPWFSLPAEAMQSPTTVKLRANSDLALWHLVATVHAQQKNKAFDLMDAGAKTVWNLERDKVSPVPLPGVVWLFVMGLLGLAGTRLKAQGDGARERSEPRSFGMTPAAA